ERGPARGAGLTLAQRLLEEKGAARNLFQEEERTMNSATGKQWEGRWDQLKGKVKQAWGVLTDDDLKKVEGKYDQVVGLIKTMTALTALTALICQPTPHDDRPCR